MGKNVVVYGMKENGDNEGDKERVFVYVGEVK